MNKKVRIGSLISLFMFSITLSSCDLLFSKTQTKTNDQPTIDVNPPTEEKTPTAPEKTPTETIVQVGLDKWQEVDCFSYTYKQLANDVMPIGAWAAPTGKYNTDEQYKLLKESGLNSIYGLHDSYGLTPTEVLKALNHANNNGIVYLVRDTGMAAYSEDADDFKEYLTNYTTHPAYGGTLLVDEPGVKQFDNYVLLRKLFRQHLPKDAFYINLLPNYASKGQLENGAGGGENTMNLTYEQYIDSFLTKLQPQFLSYDYYGTNHNFPNVDDGYLEQIYFNAKKAHDSKIPFWPFIQACAFGGASRVPNDIDIFWQVNVSLAYGAKGIQYFCYYQPDEFTAAGYGGSFIDGNGERTAVYYAGQKINKQIAKMDHVLMKSTLISQMVYGDSPCTIEQDNLVTSFREISSITTEDDLLVGCFDYGGKTALYLVNNNLTENCDATINFTEYVELNLFYMNTDAIETGESVNISLKPGEGVLLEITNYK